jgi:autotransporter passenger strand-loop-strand repeat protein
MSEVKFVMTTVNSGQTQTVSQSESEVGNAILSGGIETVVAGGRSWRPVLDGGTLVDGGFVAFAHVNADGTLFDSGAAYRTTVGSGAVMYVDPVGKARGTVIYDGGTVYDGGTLNGTMVNLGGIFYAGRPVTVSGETQDFFGSADGTVLKGGTEYVLSGADNHTTIGSGGVEHVDSGGTSTHTTIHYIG